MANKQIMKGNDRPLEVESCPECEGMVLADGPGNICRCAAEKIIQLKAENADLLDALKKFVPHGTKSPWIT